MNTFGITHKSFKTSDLRTIHEYKKENAPIQVRIGFMIGSRHDPIGKSGLAHFYEHMLVAGTKSFPTKDKLVENIESRGGSISASTTREEICIDISVAEKEDFGEIINIYKSIFSENLFNQEVFNKEKKIIQTELETRNSNPSVSIFEQYLSLCYPNNPNFASIIGTKESIDSITLDDIKNFHDVVMSTDAKILLCGTIPENYDFTDIGFKKITNTNQPKVINFTDSKFTSIQKNEKDMCQVIFGVKGLPIGHPKYYDLEVITDLIAGGRSSELNKILRYKKALVYFVSGDQLIFSDTGSLIIKTAVSKNNLQEVVNLVEELLLDLSTKGFSESEINKSKNKLLKSKKMQLQTVKSWADFHTYKLNPINSEQNCFDYLINLSNVTSESVKETCAVLFKKSNFYLAVVGNLSEADIML